MQRLKNSKLRENINKNNRSEINNTNKKLIFWMKDNPKILYIVMLSCMLIFDYFVYTDVFHLNQADFFNYLMSNILTQQFFIVFIIFPLIIIGFILFIFKIEYSFFKKFEIKNYFISIQKNYFSVISMFVTFIVSFLGDIVVYNLLDMIYAFLEKQAIRFNLIAFFVIINILLFIVNIASLILLASITKIIANKITFAKVSIIFSFLLGFFFSLKLFIYPFLALFLPKLNLDYSQKFFILLNLIIFVCLAMIFIINKDFKKKVESSSNNKVFIDALGLFWSLIFMVIGVFIFFNNLEKLYRTPYESCSFWKNKIYENSLSTFNFSLFLSPLRISQLYDKTDFKMIFKDQPMKNFIFHKKLDQNVIDDMNQTIHHLIVDENISQDKIFYLPNGDRKLLFLLNDDVNKTITILHIKENNSSVIKLMDIGYINCQSK